MRMLKSNTNGEGPLYYNNVSQCYFIFLIHEITNYLSIASCSGQKSVIKHYVYTLSHIGFTRRVITEIDNIQQDNSPRRRVKPTVPSVNNECKIKSFEFYLFFHIS